MENKFANKRKLEGEVVSDKMDKTRVVKVVRTRRDPKYQKQYFVSQKFKVHDEKNEYKTGERVIIQETRPMSREKRWEIISKI